MEKTNERVVDEGWYVVTGGYVSFVGIWAHHNQTIPKCWLIGYCKTLPNNVSPLNLAFTATAHLVVADNKLCNCPHNIVPWELLFWCAALKHLVMTVTVPTPIFPIPTYLCLLPGQSNTFQLFGIFWTSHLPWYFKKRSYEENVWVTWLGLMYLCLNHCAH